MIEYPIRTVASMEAGDTVVLYLGPGQRTRGQIVDAGDIDSSLVLRSGGPLEREDEPRAVEPS